MSIENITARILKEAQDEAAALREETAKANAELIKAAEEEAEKASSGAEEKAENDAATLKERKNSVAELEARKMRLAAKQEMISQAFDQAEKALAAMPEEKYLDFLLGQLKGAERGEVILSAGDKEKIGKQLSDKLSGSGLKVSEETADITGGFILKDGNISVNASLNAILEAQKKEITAQVADILFS